MKKYIAAVLSTLALAGCYGPDDEAAHITPPEHAFKCVNPGGSYQVHFREELGACGALPDLTQRTPRTTGIVELQAGATCVERKYSNPTECGVEFERTCELNGLTFDIAGKVEWKEDGSSATGVQAVVIKNSDGGSCYSQYFVDVTQ